MERWQIVVLCVIGAVVWMLFKKFRNRGKEQKTDSNPTSTSDVESWFSKAQDRLAVMDEDMRQEKESEWSQLPPEEQLKISDSFMLNNFGDRVARSYSDEEKVKVGKAHYFLRG